MAGIHSISGLPGPTWPQRVGPTGPPTHAQTRSADNKGDFAGMLKAYLQHVEKDQHASTAAVQDLLSGRNEDILPVVSAVAKADLSFKLLVGVRNKVIEAYKQTMNMQV